MGIGLVPLADPALAAEVAGRAAAADLAGVLSRPNFLCRRILAERADDSLHDACERSGLMLAVREGQGVRGSTIGTER